MNTKFGKLTNGQIEYAPNSLGTGDGVKMNPTEASYLAAGWKKVEDVPPAPDEGCTVEPSGWTETDTALTRVYKQISMPAPDTPPGDGGGDNPSGGPGGGDTPPAPPPVGKRIFSKLKLVAALKATDKWALVKTWLEEKAYYDYYLAAQDFAEDNDLFIEGRNAIQGYLGVSDEYVESILSKCVAD